MLSVRVRRLQRRLERLLTHPGPSARLLRGGGAFVLCYLLVVGVHWPYLDLPVWNDCIGYMITNTVQMLEEGTIFQPVGHDTGHPPLHFVLLGLAWTVLGRSIIVAHLVQYLWSALLVLGLWKLGSLYIERSRWPAVWLATLGLLFPHYYALGNQLVPDLAQIALFIWVLYGFYARRPWLYGIALALFPLAKANSLVLLAFFAFAEFIVAPFIQWLRAVKVSPERAREVIRDWLRWTGISWLAAIPFLVYMGWKYAVRGYFITGGSFPESTRMHFSMEFFWQQLGRETGWMTLVTRDYDDMILLLLCSALALGFVALGERFRSREHVFWAAGAAVSVFVVAHFFWYYISWSLNLGVLAIVLSLAILVAVAFSGKHTAGKLASGESANHLLRRPPLAFASLILLQALLVVGLYTFKELKLIRFFIWAPTALILIAVLAASMFLAWLKVRGMFRLAHGFAAFVLAGIVVGCMLRLDPLLLRGSIGRVGNAWFDTPRNQNYDMDIQIVPYLRDMREAIRWIERQGAEEGTPVVAGATYPADRAMGYYEAGLLRYKETPITGVSIYNRGDMLLHQPHVILLSPMNTPPLNSEPDPEIFRDVTLELVWERTYEDDIWEENFIRIYAVNGWRPAAP